jgi:hypothetical protein
MASLINGNRMFCTNCKGDFFLILPIGLTEMCEIMRAFTKLHKDCKKHYTESETNHLIKNNMNLYTVYESPSDYPDNFVVRRWEIVAPDNVPVAKNVVIIGQNLDIIRKELREMGLFRIPRDVSDDKKIVETWV